MTSSSTSPAWRDLGAPEALAAGRGVAMPAWLGRPGRAPVRRVADGRIWPELRDGLAAEAADRAPEPAPPPPPPPDPELTFGEAEVARLCAAAAAEAAAAALADARERHGRERLRLDERLAGGLEALAAAVSARRGRVRAEAAALGAALGRALAREAVGRDPLADAGAMLAELLAELKDEPEVTVAAPAAHADELRAALAGIAARAGRAGVVEVRADPGLLAGELRLAWRDGWAERLHADLEARAAQALAALAGGGPAPGTVETVEIGEDVA